MFVKHICTLGVCAAAITVLEATAHADTVTIVPIKDNTLIESTTGDVSNALGPLFSGKTGFQANFVLLRAVLAFDVAAAVPAGSTIDSASLAFRLQQTVSGNQRHTLHKLLADWGEGTSSAIGGDGSPATRGDATWLHRFFSTSMWTTPGGDYTAAASATGTIGFEMDIDHVFTSAGLAADVQAWLDAPATNFGWILRGAETVNNSAKKLYSRHASDPALRPRLTIEFTQPSTDCPADIVKSGSVDVDDLLAVITSWGPCPAPPAACPANIATAGSSATQVDVDDLLAVITAWGPCP